MQATYYTIDEAAARQAHSMNSMREFKSDDQEYRDQVDAVFSLAEKAATNRPAKAEYCEQLADRYSRSLAQWYNEQYRIDAMCPSILISGGGNFDTLRKQKQNNRRESHWKEWEHIQGIKDKLQGIASNQAIYATDPDAVEAMTNKLESAKRFHQYMKDANAYFRKHGTLDGSSFSNSKYHDYTVSDRPFDSWELQNNLASIKRMESRLEELKRKAEATTESAGTITINGEECEVVRNAELDRLQLLFDGKPEDDTRAILKRGGFRWSPKNCAWQRQLTSNAEYSLDRISDK